MLLCKIIILLFVCLTVAYLGIEVSKDAWVTFVIGSITGSLGLLIMEV
jgi:hypothetical protein